MRFSSPAIAVLLASLAAACGTLSPPPPPTVVEPEGPPAKQAIDQVLDDWHDAAARADEPRYFGHLSPDAVFLGTDAKERWSAHAFQEYAHPIFAKGKAWTFRPTRREITVALDGATAWFDEDLDTPNLGPARGSGVLVKRDGAWRISQYNLAVTVPNERFEEVKRAIADTPPPPPGPRACPSPGAVQGVVTFSGKPPKMFVPSKRKDAMVCRDKAVPHNAVAVKGGRFADVLVRIENGAFKGAFRAPSQPVTIHEVDCTFSPRVTGAMTEQRVAFVNDDKTLHNVHSYKHGESWFNQAQPKGSEPLLKELPDEGGVVKIASDIYPWMRGFIVVTDHPFFTVTGADGAFRIDGVPPGKYKLDAWHSIYGRKQASIEVVEGRPTEVSFDYTGTEPAPEENQGELDRAR